jgi:DNA polymerase
MIRYGYCSRNISDPAKYKEIYDTRLKYKAEKNPLQAPLKLVLNSTYGAMKDKYNNLYDPLQANNVCVGGQLLLLDLIEKLEGHCQIIQSNTDGILIRIASEADFSTIDDICYEWEERTGMQLEFSNFQKVFQGDVNNYVIVPAGELFDKKGKPRWKSKGGYVKKLTDLDYDLPIVNKAIVDYMLRGIPVEDTINNCTELKMFQKIVKVSGKYQCGLWGTHKMQDKCFRVFASQDKTDSGIYKQKEGGKPEKFANTPEHCFIINEDVNKVAIPRKLDRAWYINMAKTRLADKFGVK